MVVHACNSRTWETKIGGSQVCGQLGLVVRPCLKKRCIQNKHLTHTIQIKGPVEMKTFYCHDKQKNCGPFSDIVIKYLKK
jgi:hypothetical protein